MAKKFGRGLWPSFLARVVKYFGQEWSKKLARVVKYFGQGFVFSRRRVHDGAAKTSSRVWSPYRRKPALAFRFCGYSRSRSEARIATVSSDMLIPMGTVISVCFFPGRGRLSISAMRL